MSMTTNLIGIIFGLLLVIGGIVGVNMWFSSECEMPQTLSIENSELQEKLKDMGMNITNQDKTFGPFMCSLTDKNILLLSTFSTLSIVVGFPIFVRSIFKLIVGR